jgi:hypothetical protein
MVPLLTHFNNGPKTHNYKILSFFHFIGNFDMENSNLNIIIMIEPSNNEKWPIKSHFCFFSIQVDLSLKSDL